MRNLKCVDMHRRLKGLGKSELGSPTGTFDFHLKHNRYAQTRKAVVTVSEAKGVSLVTISIKERSGGRWLERTPYPSETGRLLALFFEPWETPASFHPFMLRPNVPMRFYHSHVLSDIITSHQTVF